MRRRLGFAAYAALLSLIAIQPAWAQRPPPEHPVFGHTLMSGTGFISTPYAQVKPGIFGSVVAIFPDAYVVDEATAPASYTVLRGSAGVGLSDWIEAGVTIHGDAVGVFGKAQVIRQSGAFPAIAGGVQNIVSDGRGRYGIEDPFYDEVENFLTVYGVATYVVGPGGRNFPSWVVISGGFGSGLFGKDNPAIEDEGGVRGVFGSVAFDFQAADETFVRVMGEWDGFDLNLGLTGYVKGLEASLGVLSVTREGDPPDPPAAGQAPDPTQTFEGSFYNQTKFYVSLAVDVASLGGFPWIFKGKDEEP